MPSVQAKAKRNEVAVNLAGASHLGGHNQAVRHLRPQNQQAHQVPAFVQYEETYAHRDGQP